VPSQGQLRQYEIVYTVRQKTFDNSLFYCIIYRNRGNKYNIMTRFRRYIKKPARIYSTVSSPMMTEVFEALSDLAQFQNNLLAVHYGSWMNKVQQL